MAKVVTATIYTRDKDRNRVILNPGDPVPKGLEVPDEYLTEDPTKLTLVDYTRDQLAEAARRVGVKDTDKYSKDQLGQLIQEALFDQRLDTELVTSSAELADQTNKDGNAQAPGQGEATGFVRSNLGPKRLETQRAGHIDTSTGAGSAQAGVTTNKAPGGAAS